MPVRTKVTDLADSRVRLDAEVSVEEIESSLQRAATALGHELRIPGFRKGRVPAPMVIKRVGREAVLEQAVRESLPEWYEQAILEAGVSPVGDPELDLQELPPAGDPLTFSIEISVTPKAKLGHYKGLEVGRREPTVPASDVDRELERLREAFASVETVDRPIGKGDLAVVDFTGTVDGKPFEGGEARDYMLEIGGGRLIEGFDEQLVGARAGESREVEIDFPGDYHSEELRGRHAVFAVDVKDVKERDLPDLDDDFASAASEFDTLAELRGDIEVKLEGADERAVDDEFREAVVDAVVERAEVEPSDDLVGARAREMWERTERELQGRKIDPETYLRTVGKTREQMIEEARPGAAQQLKRESVLAEVGEAEAIDVSDRELLEALGSVTGREAGDGDKLLDRLKDSGRDRPIRREIRLRKAVDVLVEHAQPIEIERARAREKIWTPGKEEEPGPSQLWTPGDKPPGDKPPGDKSPGAGARAARGGRLRGLVRRDRH